MLISTVVSQNMKHVWKHKTKNEQTMLNHIKRTKQMMTIINKSKSMLNFKQRDIFNTCKFRNCRLIASNDHVSRTKIK